MKKQPYKVKLEKGKNYAWCKCSESINQPFCDGSHNDINSKNKNVIKNLIDINLISDIESANRLLAIDYKEPVVFAAKEDIEVSLCGCKESDSAPYCNGTHLNN